MKISISESGFRFMIATFLSRIIFTLMLFGLFSFPREWKIFISRLLIFLPFETFLRSRGLKCVWYSVCAPKFDLYCLTEWIPRLEMKSIEVALSLALIFLTKTSFGKGDHSRQNKLIKIGENIRNGTKFQFQSIFIILTQFSSLRVARARWTLRSAFWHWTWNGENAARNCFRLRCETCKQGEAREGIAEDESR